MCKRILFLLFAIVFSSFSHSVDVLPDFLTKSQLREVANELLSQIERVDATSISVRNKTREVKWEEYRKIASDRLINSSNWNELAHNVEKLHLGIVNRHSFVNFEVANINLKGIDVEISWPKFNIGYTWPKIEFYDLDSGKTINKIDGKPFIEIFESYFNHFCRIANKNGCLREFVSHLSKGYSFETNREKLELSFIDGFNKIISKSELSSRASTAYLTKNSVKNCADAYPLAPVTLLYSGKQACLFLAENAYILKILSFSSWGTEQSDFYCQNYKKDGLCQEMNEIVRRTKAEPKENLIIDVQGNRGGSENTPWIASITNNGFKDNLVQYKNIKELNSKHIRSGVFYGLPQAEDWYQKVSKDKENNKGSFLPVRGDFCRDGNCTGSHIESKKEHFEYKKLAIVTDHNCASSCDDLIWRSKSFAGAQVFGQPPSTDGAYASIKGYVLLTAKGELQTAFASGYSRTPSFEDDLLLITFQIPITKTVDDLGNLLDGDSSVLDFPLEVNRANFNNLQQDNLIRTIDYLNTGDSLVSSN